MRLIILVILFVLTHHLSFSQKTLELQNGEITKNFAKELNTNLVKFNLKDLQTSTDSLNIRIWQPNEIFTLSKSDSISSEYKIYILSNQLDLETIKFAPQISSNILDSLLSYNLLHLREDNFLGLDGKFVFIEIATINKYKLMSFWSPDLNRNSNSKIVFQSIKSLNQQLKTSSLRSEFINKLAPGEYHFGMTTINIDKFLNHDLAKTDFYKLAEAKIKTELDINETTSLSNFPLILIDNKISKLADLNNYSNNQIKDFKVIKQDVGIAGIYGSKAINGVIVLETK